MIQALFTLAIGFSVFMGLVWSVHRLNRLGAERFGYEPFAPPNVALMCVPSLLLYSALEGLPSMGGVPDAADPAALVKLGICALFLLAMLGLLAWRNNLWIALYAASVMVLAAPVVLLIVLYQRLAR